MGAGVGGAAVAAAEAWPWWKLPPPASSIVTRYGWRHCQARATPVLRAAWPRAGPASAAPPRAVRQHSGGGGVAGLGVVRWEPRACRGWRAGRANSLVGGPSSCPSRTPCRWSLLRSVRAHPGLRRSRGSASLQRSRASQGAEAWLLVNTMDRYWPLLMPAKSSSDFSAADVPAGLSAPAGSCNGDCE